jgi:soluble lytic murein transglycosylase-like protein
MKTLIIIMVLFGVICPRNTTKESKLMLFINNNMHPDIAKWAPKALIAKRYYTVIRLNAIKYDLNQMVIARMVKRETEFRWWRVGGVGEVGPMQVRPRFWYDVHKKINNAHDTNSMSQIGNGVAVGCHVLDVYKKRFKSLPVALLAYNRGPNTEKVRRANNGLLIAYFDDYVMEVLGDKKAAH